MTALAPRPRIAATAVRAQPCRFGLEVDVAPVVIFSRRAQEEPKIEKTPTPVLEERSDLVPAILAAGRSPISPACLMWLGHEGGLSPQPYPAIRAWIGRIKALPGFIAMPAL
jgi:hypothetical protein